MIVSLGWWALEEACRQVRVWQAQHPSDPPLVLSVNLSARQFQHPGLVPEIERHLKACHLDPDALSLEISEGIVVWDLQAAATTLQTLKQLGVQLTLDNFGASRVDFAYLADLPIDAVKLDRSFIEGIGRAPAETAVARAVVQAAKRLGVRVTAQGVETTAQLAELRAFGCDRIQVQGFYFARPLPGEAFGPLFASAPWWTSEEGPVVRLP